jgi:N-methylhydantoinase B
VRVQSNYEDNKDIINMCMMRIRVPEQWRGDYLAMVRAARIGDREIVRMGRELGWEALTEHASRWFDVCERQMIEVIWGLKSAASR